MKYLEYKETRQHGTPDFPYAYYHITKSHPRYNMVHHWHTQYEIIHVIEGRFNVMINDGEYMINKGEALFVPSGMMHGGTPEEAEYECLVFEPDAFLRRSMMLEARGAELISNVRKPSPNVLNENKLARKLIKRIFCELRSKKEGYRLIVQGAVMQLFGELSRIEADGGEVKNKRRLKSLKNALTFIEEHYSEPVALDEIAAASGMNSGYLCRVFREMTHKTPIEYLNYYRIECACEQIASTDDSMTDIALGCGFCDLSYFIKVFKRYKGVTPSAYGKQL